MIKNLLVALALLPNLVFGASNVRTEPQEMLFQKGIAYTKRDESSSATLNAMATTSTYVKLTSTVTTINGATAPGAGVGRLLIVSNHTGGDVTFAHESGSATAANRFDLQGAVNLVVADAGSATFLYDHGQSRWVVAGGGGAGAAWGSITGTLSNQTDLQTALNSKAATASPTFTGTVTLPVGLTGPLKAASGVVSASAINLTSEVTGDLPFANLVQIANNRFLGNNSGGSADVEELTATEATAILNSFVGDSGAGGTKGLVPAPSAGDAAANKYLKANGLWDTPSGGGGGGNYVRYIHYRTGGSNCFFARNSTSFGDIDPDADCSFQEVSGSDLASNFSCSSLTSGGNPYPGITCTNPAEKLEICAEFSTQGSSNQHFAYELHDGTSQLVEKGDKDYLGNNFPVTVCGIVDGTAGSFTVKLRSKGSTTWTIGDVGTSTAVIITWTIRTP